MILQSPLILTSKTGPNPHISHHLAHHVSIATTITHQTSSYTTNTRRKTAIFRVTATSIRTIFVADCSSVNPLHHYNTTMHASTICGLILLRNQVRNNDIVGMLLFTIVLWSVYVIQRRWPRGEDAVVFMWRDVVLAMLMDGVARVRLPLAPGNGRR